MKIKFRLSQITILDPQIIKGLIQLKLKDKDYNVSEVKDNSVKFYDSLFAIRSRSEAFTKLDGGVFTISTIDNSTTVTLIYYVNLLIPLIGISIPMIATIIAREYGGIIFFTVFAFIAVVIQIIASKGIAKNLMISVLREDVLN